MVQPVNGKCNDTLVNQAKIQADMNSGVLKCDEKDICVFDAAKYKELTGKDIRIGELKCDYGLPENALTSGLAGKKNYFRTLDIEESYDDLYAKDVGHSTDKLGGYWPSFSTVAIPKSAIDVRLSDKTASK